MIDCDGVDDSEEYRVQVTITKRGDRARGRLQRHLAAGPHVHQRHRARRQDDGRRRVEVPLRPARRRSRRACYRNIDIVLPGGHRRQRAAARRRDVPLLRAEPGAALRDPARARRRASARRAMAGDRGGTDIHNAHGAAARRHAVGLRGPVRRRARPVRRQPPRRRRQQMFSYQANGIATAVEAIEADVPVVMLRHEFAARQRGAGLQPRRRGVVRDTLWLAPAEHHLMPLRAKRPRASASTAGATGRRAACGSSSRAGRRASQAPRAPSPRPTARRRRSPGVVDPETKLPTPTASTSTLPAGRPRDAARAILRYLNARRRRLGRSARARARARQARRARRLRDDRGRARDYGVVVAGDPEDDPEGLTSTSRRPSGCGPTAAPRRLTRRALGADRGRARRPAARRGPGRSR